MCGDGLVKAEVGAAGCVNDCVKGCVNGCVGLCGRLGVLLAGLVTGGVGFCQERVCFCRMSDVS